jgi:hypothetical protein
MKAQSERPTPRLQDTELQPICRHGTGAQPTGHAQEYRPPQISSDSTARRPMLETTSADPSGCAPAPWIAARTATTDIPRNYPIRARQQAPRRTATRTALRHQPDHALTDDRWPRVLRRSHDVDADPGDERFPNRTNPVQHARPTGPAESRQSPIAGLGWRRAESRLARQTLGAVGLEIGEQRGSSVSPLGTNRPDPCRVWRSATVRF